MKLIIDIDDETYETIKNAEPLKWDCPIESAYKAIKNGTPLSKRHGELVDIRPLMRGLYEEMCVGELTYTTSEVYKMLENEAPTIIEADKEEK